MGNCLSISSPNTDPSRKSKTLPIHTSFKLPSPLPSWPPGEGFGTGTIDLGGLEVCQISSFTKIWAANWGGPDNLGATFFEPSPIPDGFFMLGSYSQPNNKPLFGWVLVGKDDLNGALERPVDYSLVWSSESLNINQEGNAYVWLPTPPDGYKAMGHVVTVTSEKPPPDKVRCVRADFTDQCEAGTWVWGPGKDPSADGFSVLSMRPGKRGTEAEGVCVGTFVCQIRGANFPQSLACLKKASLDFNSMPNLIQIEAIIRAYSPWIYFHPEEKFFPSTVRWFFSSGALLYKKGEESNPIPIDPTGANLPQGGSNDGAYWIDLPTDRIVRENAKKGNLQSCKGYFHVKPMFGGTFTDIAIWLFYPFNGSARAKIQFINISLGKIGEHVGDWEHLTLRISNFTGELHDVYFSQHSGGAWVKASDLEFRNGNKPVAYSSLHGHAFYPKPGLVLQGSGGIGIRNDTAKSKMVMDTGVGFSVLGAEYLCPDDTVEPPWINYCREWGPKIDYDVGKEIEKVEKVLPRKLKSALEKLVRSLPDEVLGEEGPTGPKMKRNWSGDEV